MGWSNDPLAALAAGGLVLLALAGRRSVATSTAPTSITRWTPVLRSGSSNVSGLGSSHSSGSGSSGNSRSGITGSGATSAPGGGLTFTFTISQHDWSQIVALVNSPNQNINYRSSSGEDFLARAASLRMPVGAGKPGCLRLSGATAGRGRDKRWSCRFPVTLNAVSRSSVRPPVAVKQVLFAEQPEWRAVGHDPTGLRQQQR